MNLEYQILQTQEILKFLCQYASLASLGELNLNSIDKEAHLLWGGLSKKLNKGKGKQKISGEHKVSYPSPTESSSSSISCSDDASKENESNNEVKVTQAVEECWEDKNTLTFLSLDQETWNAFSQSYNKFTMGAHYQHLQLHNTRHFVQLLNQEAEELCLLSNVIIQTLGLWIHLSESQKDSSKQKMDSPLNSQPLYESNSLQENASQKTHPLNNTFPIKSDISVTNLQALLIQINALVVCLRTLALVALQTSLTLSEGTSNFSSQNPPISTLGGDHLDLERCSSTLLQQQPIPAAQHILLSTCIHVTIAQLHVLQFIKKRLPKILPMNVKESWRKLEAQTSKSCSTRTLGMKEKATRLVRGMTLSKVKAHLTKAHFPGDDGNWLKWKKKELPDNPTSQSVNKDKNAILENEVPDSTSLPSSPLHPSDENKQSQLRSSKHYRQLMNFRRQALKSLLHMLEISKALQAEVPGSKTTATAKPIYSTFVPEALNQSQLNTSPMKTPFMGKSFFGAQNTSSVLPPIDPGSLTADTLIGLEEHSCKASGSTLRKRETFLNASAPVDSVSSFTDCAAQIPLSESIFGKRNPLIPTSVQVLENQMFSSENVSPNDQLQNGTRWLALGYSHLNAIPSKGSTPIPQTLGKGNYEAVDESCHLRKDREGIPGVDIAQVIGMGDNGNRKVTLAKKDSGKDVHDSAGCGSSSNNVDNNTVSLLEMQQNRQAALFLRTIFQGYDSLLLLPSTMQGDLAVPNDKEKPLKITKRILKEYWKLENALTSRFQTTFHKRRKRMIKNSISKTGKEDMAESTTASSPSHLEGVIVDKDRLDRIRERSRSRSRHQTLKRRVQRFMEEMTTGLSSRGDLEEMFLRESPMERGDSVSPQAMVLNTQSTSDGTSEITQGGSYNQQQQLWMGSLCIFKQEVDARVKAHHSWKLGEDMLPLRMLQGVTSSLQEVANGLRVRLGKWSTSSGIPTRHWEMGWLEIEHLPLPSPNCIQAQLRQRYGVMATPGKASFNSILHQPPKTIGSQVNLLLFQVRKLYIGPQGYQWVKHRVETPRRFQLRHAVLDTQNVSYNRPNILRVRFVNGMNLVIQVPNVVMWNQWVLAIDQGIQVASA